MTIQHPHEVTAFEGTRRIASGPLALIAPKVQEAMARGTGPVLIFDDRTGDQIDVDVSRLSTHAEDGSIRRIRKNPMSCEGRASPAGCCSTGSYPPAPALGVVGPAARRRVCRVKKDRGTGSSTELW